MEIIAKKLGYCRLCLTENVLSLFTKEGYEVARCRRCGFTFLNSQITPQFLKDYYSENFFNDPGIKHGFSNYENEFESLKITFAERINIIKKYKPMGSLLDIGCATGTFMLVAKKFWRVYGAEISSYASQVASGKGLEVYTGEIENSPYANLKFDVITLWDTVEHLIDPNKTFETIKMLTNPGSIVALTTGDVRSLFSKLSGKYWHLYNIPQHLSYFDQKSISKLFESHGFKIKQINYPSVNFTLDYLMFRLLTFYKINRLIPLYRWLSGKNALNKSIKVNLGDIMFVIGQRE